jgi:hypothetical protein
MLELENSNISFDASFRLHMAAPPEYECRTLWIGSAGVVKWKINGIKELRQNEYTDGKAKTGFIELNPINDQLRNISTKQRCNGGRKGHTYG